MNILQANLLHFPVSKIPYFCLFFSRFEPFFLEKRLFLLLIEQHTGTLVLL